MKGHVDNISNYAKFGDVWLDIDDGVK